MPDDEVTDYIVAAENEVMNVVKKQMKCERVDCQSLIGISVPFHNSRIIRRADKEKI